MAIDYTKVRNELQPLEQEREDAERDSAQRQCARTPPALLKEYASGVSSSAHWIQGTDSPIMQTDYRAFTWRAICTCTQSNEWTGKYSFGGKSLHHINDAEPNPYQRVINVVARTLSAFDDDNLIPW